jgi:hypothetical protein
MKIFLRLEVSPNLPNCEAELDHVPLPDHSIDLIMKRIGQTLAVIAKGDKMSTVRLESRVPGAKIRGASLDIPLPAVEIGTTGKIFRKARPS